METITKKIAVPLLFILMITIQKNGFTQDPVFEDPNSGNQQVAITNPIYNEGTLISNDSGVHYYDNGNVDYISASKIHLIDGFHAGLYINSNKFHAQINNLTVLEPTNGDYEQLEKMEWAITIPNMNISRYNYDANWSNQTLLTNLDLNKDISDFFDQTTYPNPYTNPYDPDDIDIEVTFKHESGQTFKTWGFYYRGFEYDNDGSASMEDLPESWVPITNDFGWRVRFAPPLTGNYTSCIKITTYRNTAHETAYENCNNTPFNVVTSDNPGYLMFANGAKHLSFSKQPGANTFFPIGNNLVSDMDANKYTSYPAEYYFMRKYVENLSGRGNYARLTFNVNGYWIEYDEPGNYDTHQKTMWELDSMVYTAEQNDVYLLFSLIIYEELFTGFGGASGLTVAEYLNGDGKLDTRDFFGDHPYRKPYQLGDAVKLNGIIDGTTPLTDFFGEDDSKQLLKNRYRYIISRWGYSTNVSAYDLMGEIDNLLIKEQVKSDSSGIERNWGNEAETGIEALAKSWTGEMAGFLKINDPNHLKTICTFANEAWFGDNNHVFNAANLDYVSFDDYGSRRNHNILNRASYVEEVLVNTVYNTGDTSTEYNTNDSLRPVELLEFGHNNNHSSNATEMYTSSSVHNAFWSSSFMGAIGSGSYFYKQYISDIGLKKAELDASGIYDSTIYFTEPGQTASISHKAKDYFWPCWYPISDANCSARQDLIGNLIGSVGSTSNITPDFTHHLRTLNKFMNEILPENSVNLQDNYIPKRYPTSPTDINNQHYNNSNKLESFMLQNDNKNKVIGWVHNRSSYWGNLDFIDAYNDDNSCSNYTGINGFDTIGTPVNSYLYDGDDFNSNGYHDTEDDTTQTVIEYTNSTGMPSFQITGLDNNRQYAVQWYNTIGTNNTNGISSPPGSPTTTATTSSSGVLTVTPPDMTNTTTHDYAFIITGGESSQRKSRIIESGGNSYLQLTPNPSKGIFNLSLSEISGGEVQVINSVGALVYQKTITATNTLVIDLSHKPKGVYYIKVITESGVKVEKIIKN